MVIFGLYLACVFIFLGKAIADITSNKTSWKDSIFSKNAIDSFFGSKEYTYVRKDHQNPVLNWLFHTILVPFTDIWHLGNSIRRVGIYLAVTFSMTIGNKIESPWWFYMILILVFILMNVGGFHVFYHYILRKKRSS